MSSKSISIFLHCSSALSSGPTRSAQHPTCIIVYLHPISYSCIQSIIRCTRMGQMENGTPAKTAAAEQTLVKSMIAFCFAMAIKSNLIRNKLFQSTGRLGIHSRGRARVLSRAHATLSCMATNWIVLAWHDYLSLRHKNNIVFDCLFVRAKINECCGRVEHKNETR